MATSPRSFLIELYHEYLEEASFLYEQRLGLYHDPEVSWQDIHDFEERFEAHIDGLVVGDELALQVCERRASEGDSGERHAAVRVFCRQKRKNLIYRVLEELDSKDAEIANAVGDALKYELPADWEKEIIGRLSDGEQKWIALLGKLVGYRRLPAGEELFSLLERSSIEILPGILWALGRLGEQNTRIHSIRHYIQHQSESVCSAAAVALLRLGDQQTIDDCMQHPRWMRWSPIPLGLGGSRATVSALLKLATTGEAPGHCLIALGLLGDISAVPILLDHLRNPQMAESSAIGLELLTGANLLEETFIPEEIDEDELFDEELEKFKQGELPMRPDGRPFGTTITRVSRKHEEWMEWWRGNRSRFHPAIRYRSGKPYSPRSLLENLESELVTNSVRSLAYEELVIRYGLDIRFETDMSVSEQKRTLQNIGAWVNSNAVRFQDGSWYFAGRLMI
jgi:uncharacterized protein (TIGR02270 family)